LRENAGRKALQQQPNAIPTAKTEMAVTRLAAECANQRFPWFPARANTSAGSFEWAVGRPRRMPNRGLYCRAVAPSKRGRDGDRCEDSCTQRAAGQFNPMD